MKTLKKLSLEEFKNKYQNRRHISCGIHFTDGTMLTINNMTSAYVEYIINSSEKELKYIAIF